MLCKHVLINLTRSIRILKSVLSDVFANKLKFQFSLELLLERGKQRSKQLPIFFAAHEGLQRTQPPWGEKLTTESVVGDYHS